MTIWEKEMKLKVFGICSAVILLYGGDVFARNEVDENSIPVKEVKEFWREKDKDDSRSKLPSRWKAPKKHNLKNTDSQETLVPDEEENDSRPLRKEFDLESRSRTAHDFTEFCKTIMSDFDELKKELIFLKKEQERLSNIKSSDKQEKQVAIFKDKLENHKNKLDEMISDLNKLQTWFKEFNISKKLDELNSSKSTIDTICEEMARTQLVLWENKIKSYRKALSQLWNVLQNYAVTKDKIGSSGKKCFVEVNNSSKLFDLNLFAPEMFNVSEVKTTNEIKNKWNDICVNLYPNAKVAWSEIMNLQPNDQEYDEALNKLRNSVKVLNTEIQSLIGKYSDKGSQKELKSKHKNSKKSEIDDSFQESSEKMKGRGSISPRDLQAGRSKLKKSEIQNKSQDEIEDLRGISSKTLQNKRGKLKKIEINGHNQESSEEKKDLRGVSPKDLQISLKRLKKTETNGNLSKKSENSSLADHLRQRRSDMNLDEE